jgi:hemolysin-activating ACP:hemolysin acyltransferase
MFWKKAKPNPTDTAKAQQHGAAAAEVLPENLARELQPMPPTQPSEPTGAALLLTDPSLAGLFASLSSQTDSAASSLPDESMQTSQLRTPRKIVPLNARPWNEAALGLGEVMSVLQRSPRHRKATLADLDWMILPALRFGQYRIAKDAKRGGATPPEALIAWAKVSPAVDARIMANPHQPIHLAPSEWQSGQIVWIVDAAGSNRIIAQMMQQLAADIVQTPVKFRAAGPQGVLQVRMISPNKDRLVS